MAKTWQEKMADKTGTPKILKLEKRFPCDNAVHKMGAEVGDEVVLVNPREVEALMQTCSANHVSKSTGRCGPCCSVHPVGRMATAPECAATRISW